MKAKQTTTQIGILVMVMALVLWPTMPVSAQPAEPSGQEQTEGATSGQEQTDDALTQPQTQGDVSGQSTEGTVSGEQTPGDQTSEAQNQGATTSDQDQSRSMTGEEQTQTGETSGQEGMQSSSGAPVESMQSTQTSQPGQATQTAQTDAPIFIEPAAVQKIQQKLSEEGHDAGKADGAWGAKSASALKSFQKAQGLPETGNLNLETLQAMNMPELFDAGMAEPSGEQGQQMASGKGVQLYISPVALRDIQQDLSQKGFDLKADGVWGSNTQEAIRTFQQENGMKPTGNISISMLEKLGMSQMVAALGLETGAAGEPEEQLAMSDRDQTAPEDQAAAQDRMATQDQAASTEDQLAQQEPAAGDEEARGYFGQAGDQVRGQGAPLYAGADMIRQVQEGLSKAGYDPGEADGIWGPSTRKALNEYQTAENKQATGVLTVATIKKLTSGVAAASPAGESETESEPMDTQQSVPDDQRERPESMEMGPESQAPMGSDPGLSGGESQPAQ